MILSVGSAGVVKLSVSLTNSDGLQNLAFGNIMCEIFFILYNSKSSMGNSVFDSSSFSFQFLSIRVSCSCRVDNLNMSRRSKVGFRFESAGKDANSRLQLTIKCRLCHRNMRDVLCSIVLLIFSNLRERN